MTAYAAVGVLVVAVGLGAGWLLDRIADRIYGQRRGRQDDGR